MWEPLCCTIEWNSDIPRIEYVTVMDHVGRVQYEFNDNR